MINMDKTLVIMAAGMGSRYGGNKQIDGMGPHNEVLMLYSIYDAVKAGFNKVVFIIKHAIEDAFKSTVGARAEKAGAKCALCVSGAGYSAGRFYRAGGPHQAVGHRPCHFVCCRCD